MIMVVEAKKSARSSCENCRSRPCQARSGSTRANQSHRNRSARPAHSRCQTPSPPYAIGRHTRLQLTWQWPPLATARPAHKKPRWIFANCLSIFFGGANACNCCTSIALRTYLTRARCPALFMSHAFQVGSRAATVSTRGCNWAAEGCRVDNGMPR